MESRPLLEGQHAAEYLSKYFETHLNIDAALLVFIKEVDLVVVEVDSILKDGSIINKIGTYPLAYLAHSNGKKIYILGDSFKYNLRSHYDQEISIEKSP
ncbi:MAG: hypothetical protein BAJALOKI1v1_610004 [Promethearchaeota archaeon]|nr:MAG: hypothetical protein BAJALOKI1v1_610004 [Candidatus Lokiarchaeota archaeon]